MNRYLVCAAYYIVGMHYHSGQWSKGYEKMCKAGRHLRLGPGAFSKGSEERSAAARLLWQRRNEIRKEW